MDQSHELAVRCELPGLNTVIPPVSSVLLNRQIWEMRRPPANLNTTETDLVLDQLVSVEKSSGGDLPTISCGLLISPSLSSVNYLHRNSLLSPGRVGSVGR